MSIATQSAPAATTPARHGARRVRASFALGVALVAAGVLIVATPDTGAAPLMARATAEAAWPEAERAKIPANLSDGPAYKPVMFLDARTSIGTAATPDGAYVRLVLRNTDGSVRELRRLPMDDSPLYDNVTVSGDDLAWGEVTQGRTRLWTVNLRGGTPARQLTADTGRPLFYGSQYDLVIADGRLHWAVAGQSDRTETEIRSVPLTGGTVQMRTESGRWALTAWPWLVDRATDSTGTGLLRNMSTKRETAVAAVARHRLRCTPTWCRAVAVFPDGNVRIDVLRPDGTGRQRVSRGTTSAPLTDVALLDRFEILSEPGPDADLTGNAKLLCYDISTQRTVDISPDAGNVGYRNGVLWWSTGLRDDIVWHSIDLRTV